MKKIQGMVVKSDALKDLEKGDTLYNEKKYQEAIAAYEAILEKNPDLHFIKKNIGDCYFAMQNYEKAVEYYFQVNEKQPDRGDVLIAIANAYGKLTGSTQVEELGTLETPIVLTNTLSVPTAADALLDYILALPGNETVASVNPLVGETNDGWLNDIRGRHVTKAHVLEAIRGAAAGPVEEGAVGAGTGTTSFGFKGGIGTSSRRLPESRGGYTVGVLVQNNFGGILTIAGVVVGPKLRAREEGAGPGADGSCLIVVATDAPLDARNLKRLARRALLGIPRTGGYYSHGSGDYAIAFSTAPEVRVPHRADGPTRTVTLLRDEAASRLFLAAAEAAEEAILNSLFKAERTVGLDGHVAEALPLDRLKPLLSGVLRTP